MIYESMNCQMLVELVTDWLEGQLPEPTRSEVELHVATCADCVVYVEQMRMTVATLGRLESIETIEPTDDSTRDRLLAVFRARHA